MLDRYNLALACIGFGGSVVLSDKFTLFAEYQYILLGDAKTEQNGFTDGSQIDSAAAREALIGISASFR